MSFSMKLTWFVSHNSFKSWCVAAEADYQLFPDDACPGQGERAFFLQKALRFNENITDDEICIVLASTVLY
jgi:hypothetical protein